MTLMTRRSAGSRLRDAEPRRPVGVLISGPGSGSGSDNADTARLFGGAVVDLGWTQAAEQQFKRTLAINPRDAYSAFNLAVLCLTGTPQRLEEARKWYEQAVANGAEKDPKFEAAFKTRQ